MTSLLSRKSVWAVVKHLYAIGTEYNGTSEATNTHIDDERCEMMEYGANYYIYIKLGRSDTLQDCSIASRHKIRLGSANVNVYYRHQII